MFRMELQNVTNAGAGARPEQRTILFPSESVCNLPMEVREQRRRQFLRK
jgi:hypothetical protein